MILCTKKIKLASWFVDDNDHFPFLVILFGLIDPCALLFCYLHFYSFGTSDRKHLFLVGIWQLCFILASNSIYKIFYMLFFDCFFSDKEDKQRELDLAKSQIKRRSEGSTKYYLFTWSLPSPPSDCPRPTSLRATRAPWATWPNFIIWSLSPSTRFLCYFWPLYDRLLVLNLSSIVLPSQLVIIWLKKLSTTVYKN